MSSTGGIVKKEVKELLTPGALIPIVIFALIFGSLGSVFGGIEDTLAQKPHVGLIVDDDGSLATIAEGSLRNHSFVIFNGTSVSEGIEAVQELGGIALIVIPANFTENIMNNSQGIIEIYWIMRGAGISDTITSTTLDPLIYQARTEISTQLIETHAPLDSGIILNPTRNYDTTIFKGREMVGISPLTISSVMSSQNMVVPIIVLMVILMAGSMVITSMGNEKENKTLETLLTLPIPRTSIILGKLIGAAIVGMIMAFIYMLGFGNYMSGLSGSSTINLAQYGMTLDALDYVLIGISLFLALVAALALCMILGIFTKNYKAAQTMTLPITLLAMIPMFVTIAADFDTLPTGMQAILFLIPFSHPMIAVRALMVDGTGLVIAGIGYEVLFTLVAMLVAVTLFKKDILLTGRVKSSERRSKYPLIALFQALFGKKRA